MSLRKAHSQHNEEVCDLLLANGKFNDWVITSAFYSAMHLVLHQIFPAKIDGKDYADFESYYNLAFPRLKRPSKHTVIKKIVQEKLRGASPLYHSLFTNCHSARYNDYQVSVALAQKAKKDLGILKGYCSKP